jgi:hypothetical protein
VDFLIAANEPVDLPMMLMMSISTGNAAITTHLIKMGIRMPELTESEYNGGVVMLQLLINEYPDLPKIFSENYPRMVHSICADDKHLDLLNRILDSGVHVSTWDLVVAAPESRKAIVAYMLDVCKG